MNPIDLLQNGWMKPNGGTSTQVHEHGESLSRRRSAPADIRQMVMVLHGPEIFDSGKAEWLSRVLSPRRILVAGVMARAAAEESGLPCEYMSVPPSVAIRALCEPCYLAEEGKTPESGRIFGEIVASRLGQSGLIQVECASGEVICWNREADGIVSEISFRTGYPVLERYAPANIIHEGHRIIRGCIPGEAVFVNGTVIGYATGEEVRLRIEGSTFLPVSGLRVKEHGLEKLQRAGPVDISRAWCKSGTLRSRVPLPRACQTECGRVLFVDHCGHHLYRLMGEGNICGIVSVGDDTTAVCGHIGAHLGIPVFGIVDGDSDQIVPPRYAPGSLLAVAQGISDDELGREVSRIVPDETVSWGECVTCLVAYIGDRARFIRPK